MIGVFIAGVVFGGFMVFVALVTLLLYGGECGDDAEYREYTRMGGWQ